ncbi:MAG: hypothetical protein WAU32_06845 [Thermoanaerobaculia bacterium]
MIKLPFLSPVVPPHVFCLLPEGVTYARVRSDEPAGFEEVRHFRYPGGLLPNAASGAPVLSREAVAEAVKAARALSGGRLSRASVLYPDAWARILPVELETLPPDGDAGRQIVLWKLKKLLPATTGELAVVWEPMPSLTEEKRVLVAATPRETVTAIEGAFEELGVRVGCLAPASLALFEGLAPALASAAAGDYALIHRSGDGGLAFFIAREGKPIFFRHRPSESEEDQEREARLSLSYYAERLKGPGLSAVYVHDELPGKELQSVGAFPVPVVPLSSRVLSADRDFDERVAARPELLAGFAAVCGGA